MAFKISLPTLLGMALFSCLSCYNKQQQPVPVTERRLFKIMNVEEVFPERNLMYYGSGTRPFFLVTLKNISEYDLMLHYDDDWPDHICPCPPCITFYNYDTQDFPNFECMYFGKIVSRLFKKGEALKVRIELSRAKKSNFIKYEYVRVGFWALTSSSEDLSFYFTGKPQFPYNIIRTQNIDNGLTAYYYPLEFTYWIPNQIFWERYLLDG